MDPTREQLEALLADYVDGTLAGEELARAEAFLDANPGVRDVMARLMVDSEAIRTLPRVAPPVADLSEDLRGQLERNMLLGDGGPSVEPAPRRVSTQALAIAAILVVGIGASLAAYIVLANRPEPTILAQNEKANTEAASRASVVPNNRSPSANRARRSVADASATAKPATQASPIVGESRDAASPPMALGGVGGGGSGGGMSVRAMGNAAIMTDRLSTGVRVSADVAPADVVAWVAAHGAASSGVDGGELVAPGAARTTQPSLTVANGSLAARRRAIVFVVETAGDMPAERTRLADSAATFFRDNRVDTDGAVNNSASGSRGALANASFSAAADSARDRPFGGAAERQIASNVATTSPIAQAMADANAASGTTTTQPASPTTTPSLFAMSGSNDQANVQSETDADGTPGTIARDVPEAVAAQWQGQIEAMPVVARVDAYVLDESTASPTAGRTDAPGLGFGGVSANGPTSVPNTSPSATQTSLAQSMKSEPPANAPAGGTMSQLSGVALDSQAAAAQPSNSMQQLSMQRQQVPSIADATTQPTNVTSNVDVYVIVRSKPAPATQP